MSTVYVSGHRNPDTDSIASAIGYAELKSRLDPNTDYIPVRLGDLNPQTRWVLTQADATEPELLPHIRLRAGDGSVHLIPFSSVTSVCLAWYRASLTAPTTWGIARIEYAFCM